MGHLCGIMQSDFQYGWGRYDEKGNEGYSDNDLRYGIQFATDMLDAGHTLEPLYHYDLAAFRRWCRKQLATPRVQRTKPRPRKPVSSKIFSGPTRI